MKLFASYRTPSGNWMEVPLESKEVGAAILEAKRIGERHKALYVRQGHDYPHAYEPLEIVDEERNGYTVWQEPALTGVRGWKG